MLPDRVSNIGPLTYESGALPIALRGPAAKKCSNRTELVLFPSLSEFVLYLMVMEFDCLSPIFLKQ